MSAVSSRPRVKSVTSTSAQAAALGAVAVGTVVVAALRALAREALPSVPAVTPSPVDRLAAGPEVAARLARLRDEASRQVAGQGANAVAVAKARTLLALTQAPIVVQPAAVAAHVERLLAAPTVGAARQAETALLDVVQAEHTRILGATLAAVCQEASIQAGFPTVQTSSGIGGVLRVVATDQAGLALVTEIDAGDKTRPARVETEAVGVTDGSCHDVLNRFDAALETQGVVADGRPERKWTGGVCELSLAREFMRHQITPAAPATASARGTKRPSHRRRARILQSTGR